MLFNLILWDEMQEAAQGMMQAYHAGRQGMSEHVTPQLAHQYKLWRC